jgi:hypothetical protein
MSTYLRSECQIRHFSSPLDGEFPSRVVLVGCVGFTT